MKLTTLEYRETRSFGQYSNGTVGAVVQVNPEDGHENTYLDLVAWVQAKIAHRIEREERQREEAYQLREKTGELERLEEKIAAAQAKWERVAAFLKKHDIPLPHSFRDDPDMPF